MDIRTLMTNSVIHGMFIYVLFAGLSFWYPDTQVGFFVALLLCGLSSWFRPCFIQLGFGATIALVKLSLISFLLIEGSAAIIALPLMSVIFATALFLGVLAAKAIRFLIAM